jgi:hypothetical protein
MIKQLRFCDKCGKRIIKTGFWETDFKSNSIRCSKPLLLTSKDFCCLSCLLNYINRYIIETQKCEK